jgi:hypothetical protein
MASSGKRKTTMAKLARERRLHERRVDKQAKKEARKHAAQYPGEPGDEPTIDLEEAHGADAGPDFEPVAQTPAAGSSS